MNTPRSSVINCELLSDADESDLWREAATGDEACMAEIYRRYWQPMRQYALSILNSVDTAEDATQEAFARTLQRVRNGREIRNIGAWLNRCVRNCSIDIERANKRWNQVPIEDLNLPTQGPSTPRAARLHKESNAVLGAINELPARQRQALVMAEVQGYAHSQIAKEIGTTAGSVRVLLHRARQRVRETVGLDTGWAGVPILQRLTLPLRRKALEVGNGLGQWLSSLHDRIDHSWAYLALAVLSTAAVVGSAGLLIPGQSGESPGLGAGAQPNLPGSTERTQVDTGGAGELGQQQGEVGLPQTGSSSPFAGSPDARGPSQGDAAGIAARSTSAEVGSDGAGATAPGRTFNGAQCVICDSPNWQTWTGLLASVAVSPIAGGSKSQNSGVTLITLAADGLDGPGFAASTPAAALALVAARLFDVVAPELYAGVTRMIVKGIGTAPRHGERTAAKPGPGGTRHVKRSSTWSQLGIGGVTPVSQHGSGSEPGRSGGQERAPGRSEQKPESAPGADSPEPQTSPSPGSSTPTDPAPTTSPSQPNPDFSSPAPSLPQPTPDVHPPGWHKPKL